VKSRKPPVLLIVAVSVLMMAGCQKEKAGWWGRVKVSIAGKKMKMVLSCW
jgi:uncharacterized lipoprotein YajG